MDNKIINSNLRWTIVALLFFATTINYIDRQVIGLLKPIIEKDLNWTELDYGYIVSAFQLFYAIGLLLSGWLLDKFGTRIGYSIAILIWSLGGMFHAFASSAFSFGIARSVLGFGEAANFPAAIKTVAEWFPKRERALATGIFNSGSSVGAIIAPFIVAVITISLGWKWAFIITGALGIIWIVFWLLLYEIPERHKRVSKKELDYILSEKESAESVKISWSELFKYKQTYIICITRFITDWVWWFFLFWAPDFLHKTQGIDIKGSVLPLIVIYSIASVGGIFGGYLSSYFIKKGKSVDYSRKTAILICILLILPLVFAVNTESLWIAVILIGLAGAAHQGWASNIFTIISDIYPQKAIGSMVGLSGFVGSLGGALSASFVGLIIQITNSYFYIFLIAGLTYYIAWIILKIFIPEIKPLIIKH
jgi:ACS family hexuronate transporter-like MFS transporter